MAVRTPELGEFVDQIVDHVVRSRRPHLPLGVIGRAGEGKSTVCRHVREALEEQSRDVVVIDCARFRAPQRLDLLAEMVTQLPGDHQAVVDTIGALFNAPGDRARLFETARSGLADAVSSANEPVILVDGFEQLPENVRGWFMREIEALDEFLKIVIFVDDALQVSRGSILVVPAASNEEVVAMAGEAGVDLGLERARAIVASAAGNRSRARILVSAMAEGVSPEHGETFEQTIVRLFDTLPRGELLLLRVVAEFPTHVDRDDLDVVRDALDITLDVNVVRELTRMGLLLPAPEGEPLLVAAAARDPLLRHTPRESVSKAARALYDSAGKRLFRGASREVEFRLLLARLQYELSVEQVAALARLRKSVQECIRESRLDEASALLSLTERESLSSLGSVHVAHMRARYLIAEFEAEAAWNALSEVAAMARKLADRDLLAEQLTLEARCTVNPSPLPHGDLFEAVRQLEEARSLISAESPLHPEVMFLLGVAYRSVGRSYDSIKAFGQAQESAALIGDLDLALSAMAETAQSYRYLQDLPAARQSLQGAFAFKGEHELTSRSGTLDYYSANLLRDEGEDWASARKAYSSAEQRLRLAGDENAMCCLYGDWAWLEYLDGDFVRAAHFLEASFDIANRYRFRAEIAEYWHSKFHLARDSDRPDDARTHISTGLAEARRASNIYMILDCSMHTAEFHRVDQAPELIERVLDEMTALERRGCGIKVFRGRTQVVYAASLAEAGNRNRALEFYMEGLQTVAQFGNSRSNVETFDEILDRHQQQIISLLVEYGDEVPRDQWAKHDLVERFPQFLALCDRASEERELLGL